MISVQLKEVSDYFAQLSAAHVDILHTPTNVAFCRYNDNEQFSHLRNNASKNIVLIKSFFGRSAGAFDDKELANGIVVCFSCYAKTVMSADIVTATEKALRILFDFWNKMMHDFGEDDCVWLKKIDWENIQFDEIEQPWLQNHYGWDLVIPYKTYLPAYDATKWTV